ncbi:MAG: ABC transporter substrate-binding protein [Candidatus Limnocylindrales bacterium]
MKRDWKKSLGLIAATAMLVLACGGPGATTRPSTAATSAPVTAAPATTLPTSAPATTGAMTSVQLQLQWEPQAQFAGYFAADGEGYYEAEGLDVELLRGGAEVIPQVVGSDPNGPEFTISWVPKVLEVRANGQSDLVDVAQIFQRSGTRSVSWAAGKGPGTTSEDNITSPEQFADKNIGVWAFGNEYEVTAAGLKYDLVENVDYTKVIQPFNMDLLLNREVDVAEAMIYNEYAQVLEATNADTGDLYQPEDLNVIDYNDVGTAMLQDAIFVRQAWLAEEGNEDLTVRFLRASFKGWIFCRDNPDKCIQYTVDAGSTLPAGHQAWMMNEINPLIWPSPAGVGAMPEATWTQTVDVAVEAGIIPGPPDEGAYRTDLALLARGPIVGDAFGNTFTKGTVEVTPGGE